MSSALSQHGAAVRLLVHIQPGSRRTEIAGLHGDRLKIRIHAPPVDGKANEELLRYLAEELHISKSNLSIVKGETSRQKTVEIQGLTLDQILELLF